MPLEEFEQAGPKFDQAKSQSQAALTADEEAELQRLSELPPIEYERVSEDAAKRFGIKGRILDKEVNSRRPSAPSRSKSHNCKGSGRPLTFHEVEPWPEPVEGEALLGELCATIRRYVSLLEHAAVAVSLWILWSWGYDGFDIAPRLAVLSPEKRCGKSTLLELLYCLTPRPLLVSGISPSAIFRTIEQAHPTLLIDECDTFMKHNEELRGILNSGHTRASANIIRNVGDPPDPRIFSTWCPMVLAAIGKLPGTVEDRSIIIPMQRKAPGDAVSKFPRNGKRAAGPRAALEILARKAKRWMIDHAARFADAEPVIPHGLHDRAADNWHPLLTIADMMGGVWLDKAREAAVALSGHPSNESDSLRVQLLHDIRGILEKLGDDRITSEALCNDLIELEEGPWKEFRKGKPISQRQLAGLLRPFGVSSRNVKISGVTLRGYHAEDFTDCFTRYLPLAPELVLSIRYSATSCSQNGDEPVFQSATYQAGSGWENAMSAAARAESSGLADRNRDFLGEEEEFIEEDHVP